MPIPIGRLFRAAPAALAAALLATCATNPVTGKRELSLVSESQEISMGQEYAAQVTQEMSPYPDSALQRYVSTIGKRIASETERPQLPWTFTVMDDPAVNAFALPGGFIFVTRGILTHMTSEAELATVVGHEIGHVTARHSARQITRQQIAQIGLLAGSLASETFAKYAGAASAGLGILFLKYGRDDETQADGLGFRYALADGYDVRKMVDMFAILQRISAQSGARVPEWQSTHPDPGNRIAATQERLKQVTVPLDGKKVGGDVFLRTIDGMVFGEDPRQGFFQGTTFLHPDLKFQFDFPSGWKTQNGASAVVAVSAAQDAIIQLSAPSGVSPAQAVSTFLGQQGVQAGATTQNNVNGNPGLIAGFTAQGDQATLQGLIAALSYGGTTYQVVGYTTTAQYSAYDAAFRRAIGSFRAVTDPAVLGVKPMRIRLVKLPKAMTLQQFDQSYPSAVGVDQIALINGVEPGTMLQSGQLVKRVVKG